MFELVMAIGILAAGIVAVLQAFAFCARSTGLFCDIADAVFLAEDALQDFEFKEHQALVSKIAASDKGKSGKFDWEYSLEEDPEIKTLYRLNYKVNWVHAEKTETLDLATFLQK